MGVMKKIVMFMLLMVALPLNVLATDFILDGTDMQITFDESEWYVFTPENILDNPELEELGITYDYMVDSFEENKAYVDAILFYADSGDYIEIFVRKSDVEDVINLNNYSHDDLDEFGQALADRQNADYEIYQNDYSFVKLEYQDAGLYLNEYVTVINGDGYSITAQKPYSFDREDELRVKKIVDSIEFDVDESLREPSNINWSTILKYSIIGACSGAFIAAIFATMRKNKKNNEG